MVLIKNALTEYYIGPVEGETEPNLILDEYIEEVNPANNETTNERGYYSGDGNPITEVDAVSLGFEFTGLFDPDQAAQALIAGMEGKTGQGRKVKFKQVRPDGTTRVGPATVTGITAGGGPAVEFPQFAATITWDRIPEGPAGEEPTP